MSPKSFSLLTFLGLILLILYNSIFIVDETQQVVVTQFGKVVGEPIKNPGYYFKIPFLHTPNYFLKNIQEWDGSPSQDPSQIPTFDKTYIWVDTFAKWKIVDPIKFFQTMNDISTANARLDDILDASLRNVITSHRLIEAVRNTNNDLNALELGNEDEKSMTASYKIEAGRVKITLAILEQAKPKLEEFGIELLDIKIKRINYVEKVRESVYGRMIAERKQIAEKFRSEGQGEAKKILGEKERELKKIYSEAYKSAQKIMGAADAKAAEVYSKAYNVDPEFYSFVKTLDTYSSTLGEKTELILSTDSEFFKYLNQIP
ncbi:MAG: protease modulator HflC [Desulfobacterales bacterium]|nr:protease modulator HflC [Desulfobacterales bacterium]